MFEYLSQKKRLNEMMDRKDMSRTVKWALTRDRNLPHSFLTETKTDKRLEWCETENTS